MGRLFLEIEAAGDVEINAHHTVEDVGLVLDQVLLSAHGDRPGIKRLGFSKIPKDEILGEVNVDISGRAWLAWRYDELLPPLIAREEKDI